MYEIGDWGNEGCTLAADEGVPASRDVEKMKGIPTVTDSSFVLVTVSLSLSLSLPCVADAFEYDGEISIYLWQSDHHHQEEERESI